MPLNENVTGLYLCSLTPVAQNSFKPAETWKNPCFLWCNLPMVSYCSAAGNVYRGREQPCHVSAHIALLVAGLGALSRAGRHTAIADAALGAECLPGGKRKYCM